MPVTFRSPMSARVAESRVKALAPETKLLIETLDALLESNPDIATLFVDTFPLVTPSEAFVE